MKLPRYISFLFILLLLVSCIAEDTSRCKKCDGVTLDFYYGDFPFKINKVNIGIFNKDGDLVESRLLDKEALSEYQGLRLGLDAGEYTAICWGNAFDNTQIEGLGIDSKLTDMRVSHPNVGTLQTIQTNDSLFYGKHVFSVKDCGRYTGVVNFKPAHSRFKICVKGLNTSSDEVFIHIANLKPNYDYNMNTFGDFVTYKPAMKIKNNLWLAQSDVFKFDYDNPIIVELINPTNNNIISTVDISTFINNNNISLDDNIEVMIPILFDFENGDISITPKVSLWEENVVIPEW